MSKLELPATTGIANRQQLLSKAFLAIASVNFGSLDPTREMINLSVSVCGATVESYSDHTLALMSDPAIDPAWRKQAALGAFAVWDDQMVSDYLSNAVLLHESLGRPNTSVRTKSAAPYLAALSHYRELSPLGEDHYAERSKQTAAIISITLHVDGLPEAPENVISHIKDAERDIILPCIKSPSLRGLIFSREYDLDAIVSIITQRNVFDAEHIIALLESPSAPLAAGNL